MISEKVRRKERSRHLEVQDTQGYQVKISGSEQVYAQDMARQYRT